MVDGWSGVVLWLEIALIGLGIGFLGGLFGKGGSAVATPLLYLVGVPAIAAVASPLPATIPGKWAAPPAPAITTCSPRSAASEAYCCIQIGVRWAETMRHS